MTTHVSRLICLLLALYFLGHAAYAVINADDFLGPAVYQIRYLVVPLVFAFLFIAIAFFLQSQTRLLIGIYSLSVIFALYAVEFYLTSKFYLGRQDNNEERRQVADVYPGFTPHRLNGFLGTTALDEAIMGHLPFTTIDLCSTDYGPARFRTDRIGLNNPDDIFEQPIAFAVTGDSFIHGHCQPPGKDIVSLVRQTVPGTVNLGLTGTGPLFQLAVLGRHGAALRPDHVVACFYEGNDLRDLPGEMRTWLAAGLQPTADFGPSPAKAETLAMVEDLNRRYAAGEEFDQRLMGGFRRERSVGDLFTNPTLRRNFAALYMTTNMLGLSYGRAPAHLTEYRAILARTQEMVASWGGRLHLCYLPARHRLGVITSHYAYDETRRRVLEVAASLDISVLDVTGDFAAHPEPRQLYASDGHLSVEGAALVAELMSSYLLELMPKPSP